MASKELKKIFFKRDSGQTLVEFALVIPIFILIVLGTFEVARILFTIHGLDVSARGGARAGIVELDDATAVTVATAAAREILGDFNLDNADTAVTAEIVQVQNADAVRVTVTRTFNFIFTNAYLSDRGSFQLFPTNIPLTTRVTMRKEG